MNRAADDGDRAKNADDLLTYFFFHSPISPVA
jgi:hypothetical protein